MTLAASILAAKRFFSGSCWRHHHHCNHSYCHREHESYSDINYSYSRFPGRLFIFRNKPEGTVAKL
ncbi:hypothetical protein NZA60_09270, partial [Escherichia coli]|uniref:hypothetical protein n=1 Tax=Escherichia coli TaxID=562 RepID=UPI0022F0C867